MGREGRRVGGGEYYVSLYNYPLLPGNTQVHSFHSLAAETSRAQSGTE